MWGIVRLLEVPAISTGPSHAANCYAEPTGLTLYQLSDDWAEMQRLAGGEVEPVALYLVKGWEEE